ncbi:MAG: hypothetical protein ACOYY2_13075 [Actinomycetota bacterium]
MSEAKDRYGRSAIVDTKPRCWRCSRLLAESVTRPWEIRCTRCKATNQGGSGGR